MANIQLFQDQKIRTYWDSERKEWFFSVIDVVSVLTDSNNPRRYYSDLKRKLLHEGFEQLYENIVQFKNVATQGGTVAGNARKELERRSGKKVVSKKNYLSKKKELPPSD